MSFKISIPFYAFRLHLHSGGSVLTAMTDKQVLRIGQTLPVLAGKYANLLQQKVLNKGQYNQLLEEYREGTFFNGQIQITFPAARDGISYPEFSLEFDLFFNHRNDGFWGIIPILGLECYANEYAKLVNRLEDAIRLDFARNKRLIAVQEILSAIWFESTELNQVQIELETPNLQTLANQGEEPQEKWLPQVAKVLNITKKVAYGRRNELDRVSRILKGKFGRNILLAGPSGVGKTALVWELARQMKKRKIKGQIWETTASTLIKELMRDTGWQENLALLCKELTGGNDLLFVRNLMELFEVGKSEGNDTSMADSLRSYLDRGEVYLISECSAGELAQIQLKSPNFLRLFHTIYLEEPQEQLEQIIQQKVKDIANLQKVQISTEAIQEVIRLNKRYTPYAGMPGKPIRFLENILLHQKEIKKNIIGRTEIIKSFCEETGLPLFMVDPSLPMLASDIKSQFNQQVFGQKKAIDGVIDMLASVKTALTRTGKPIASFLFAGPTGVGKTELAKVLAEFMFGNRDRIVRFDMSEFSSPYAVLRLLGIDYFNDGLLTSAVRRDPFCVLLFDEIEKAHTNFYDLLLQILSEGRLTDSSGQLVNFCSTIIIMTSNIGAQNLQQTRISLHKSVDNEDINQHFISAIQQYFRPELVNRIDQIIAFSPLSADTMRHIVDREITLFKQREGIRFRKIDLQIAPAVYDFLAWEGYDPKYGARHLQRIIRDQLIAPLAKTLNIHEFDDQLIVVISLEGGKILVNAQADPMGLDLLLEELEKISHANHVSQLRRQAIRFQEGHSYVRLLSELDILEHKKKKEKHKFWDNPTQSAKYSHLLAAKQRLENSRDKIEDLELKLNLSCLNLEVYQPAILENVKAWESDFLSLKKDFLAFMEPQYNHCHFAIYGVNILPILQLYLNIFNIKNYEYSAYSVWFQEAHYQKTTNLNQINADEEGYKPLSPYLKAAMPSLKTPIPFKPPEKGCTLYGIELTISGPSAYLFLRPEAGFQMWKLNPPEEDIYALQINNQVQPTPNKIHRRDFYTKKTIPRTIGLHTVRDNHLNINRELKFSDWTTFLLECLEENFDISLDAYLL